MMIFLYKKISGSNYLNQQIIKTSKELNIPINKGTIYTSEVFDAYEPIDHLLNKIKLLKTDIHDYQDAYITKEGDYFKVQCGSFSNKTNAERMSEDLKNHGYDNYIKTKLKFL